MQGHILIDSITPKHYQDNGEKVTLSFTHPEHGTVTGSLPPTELFDALAAFGLLKVGR